jgi:hypothetical protein
MKDPDPREWALLAEAAGGNIRRVTLAPERKGSCEFIAHLRSQNVVVALGHSNAAEPRKGLIEPFIYLGMKPGIFAMRLDGDIDVEQVHYFSIASRREAESFRSRQGNDCRAFVCKVSLVAFKKVPESGKI